MEVVDNTKITIIYDNNLAKVGLEYGFGFSCLLECGDDKIIFDTGGDKASFFKNIKQLSIDLNTISHIVFSHQHWDHTAGFKEVITQLSASCKIYVPFKFDKKLLAQIPAHRPLIQIKDHMNISPCITSYVLRGKTCVVKECFSVYEQFLLINSAKGLIILTGCAHPGINNILKKVTENHNQPIQLILGGFHLHRSMKKTILNIINNFHTANVKSIAPCHCSGERATLLFEKLFNNTVYKIGSGSKLTI